MTDINPQTTECKPKIGILGGGQLALLLCDAAKRLALQSRVFATNPDDPAIENSDSFQIGRFDDVEDLKEFFSQCDLVVFENEFIPASVLAEAAASSSSQLYPSAATMALCADKLEQKLLFQKLDLPTAEFLHAGPEDDGHKFLAAANAKFPQGFVLKWAKGGYDGGGVQVWQDPTPPNEKAINFIQAAQRAGSHIYAEQLIGFECEVALVAVRSTSGEFAAYPLAGTIQENQICTSVTAPVFPSLFKDAAIEAEKLATKLNFVGVFAIEFFVVDGHLLINEMAPRVHNSGHATMDGVSTSQFENHLRAVTGMPLGEISHKHRYGMINILGPNGYKGPLGPPTISLPQTRVHWYNKKQSRPGRKIGHLNFWIEQDDEQAFQELMRDCQNALFKWQQEITRYNVNV